MTQANLQIDYVDPRILKKNPWNPNVVDPVNQEKILESIRTESFFRPIICRELSGGTLEIIGGEHRTQASIDLDMDKVPVINLGEMDDAEAKRKTLLDNGRYGDNDTDRMVQLLSDEAMGSAEDLLAILPIDEAELASLFDSNAVELDALDLDLSDDGSDDIDLDLPSVDGVQSHQVMRFKVPMEDAVLVSDLITKIKHSQGYTGSDELTNAGDALVWLAQAYVGAGDA